MLPRRQPKPRYGISIRGLTYARVKAAAAKQGLGTSKLVEQFLEASEAIQMTPHDEYQLLQRLVAKRRAANKNDDDLLERMHVVRLEMSDDMQQAVEPPPEPTPQPLAESPPEVFFTDQPLDIKPSPHRPKAEGRGYIEF